jgi:hypothetical protein
MNKNRMNLRQLVAFFNSKNLTASANYFQGCANDSVTVEGWIEEDFVKRHVGYGQMWKEVKANVTTMIPMQEEFKFTFKTQDDQFDAERTGYIDSYDCVRMEVKDPQGGSIDFPVKNRESYYRLLTIHGNNIAKVYPTVHSYDIQDYQ